MTKERWSEISVANYHDAAMAVFELAANDNAEPVWVPSVDAWKRGFPIIMSNYTNIVHAV